MEVRDKEQIRNDRIQRRKKENTIENMRCKKKAAQKLI